MKLTTTIGAAIQAGVRPSLVLEWIDMGMPVSDDPFRRVHVPTMLAWLRMKGLHHRVRQYGPRVCVSHELWRHWRQGRICPPPDQCVVMVNRKPHGGGRKRRLTNVKTDGLRTDYDRVRYRERGYYAVVMR